MPPLAVVTRQVIGATLSGLLDRENSLKQAHLRVDPRAGADRNQKRFFRQSADKVMQAFVVNFLPRAKTARN